MKKFGRFVALIALAIFIVICNGYVLSLLWQWFVTPLGAPPIGVAHAVGLAAIVSFLTFHGARDTKKREAPEIAGELIAKFGVTLLIGWVAVRFMA